MEEIKAKVDNLYSEDDSTTEEMGAASNNCMMPLRQRNNYGGKKIRVRWFRESDLNTKFFHAITKHRRARNKITV